MKKAITITILFEADALNRDEKVGNVLSIKKLTRGWGETYSFISRPAIRHYLWVTLNKMTPERWKATPVRETQGEGRKKVIQFEICDDEGKEVKNTIINSAELDIFGYMVTIAKGGEERGDNLTRKAPLGITKAVSLEKWEGDMGLYANHELVKRALMQGKEATPDIYNNEEQKALYKVSFTLDVEKIGIDEWLIKQHTYRNNKDLEITLPHNHTLVLKNVVKIGNNSYKFEDKEGKIVIEDYKLKFEHKDSDRIKDVLDAIYNGLYYHSSGECPGIVPLFLIAGIVKVPVPVFHSFVDIEFYKKNHRPKFKIRENLLRNAISNGWIENEGDKKLIFVEAREPEALSEDFIASNSITTNWEQFVNKYLLQGEEKEAIEETMEGKRKGKRGRKKKETTREKTTKRRSKKEAETPEKRKRGRRGRKRKKEE